MKPQIAEKAQIVSQVTEKLGRSQIGILSDFQGLKVDDMNRLRRQLEDVDAEMQVVKNTLLDRAALGDSPLAPMAGQFTGPNALTLGYGDPVALTKVLMKFAQERPRLKIKAGVLGGKLLSVQDLDALSKLPAREVLLSQFLGVLQAVPQALVTVLAGVIRNFLNVLVAYRDKKAEGKAPAPEAAAEAAPAPEAPAAEGESA